MKRLMGILIIALSVTVFAGLIHYGWVNRWGGPTKPFVNPPPPQLPVPHKAQSLDLGPADVDAAVWDELEPVTVEFIHQVTAPPRGAALVQGFSVRAFHDGKDAYFMLEWLDADESRTHDCGLFPDAAAVAFIMTKDPPAESIMMGFQSVVNIWQWKADLDAEFWTPELAQLPKTSNDLYTYEKPAAFPVRRTPATSACQDILASRPGSVTIKDKSVVNGRGKWNAGKWRVIIKRSLLTENTKDDVQLTPGKRHVSFAVWSGNEGDRGSRKSISDWVIIDIKPAGAAVSEPKPSARIDPHGLPERAPAEQGFSLLSAAYGDKAPSSPPPSTEQKRPRIITIKAKRFEFILPDGADRLVLQKDEWVTIRLESLDVTHGLYIDGYEIRTKANPAEVGLLTFVADKTGRFSFRCSETCGEFHPYMIGYLVVEPNTRFHLFVGGLVIAGLILAGVFVIAPSMKKEAA